jgi:Heterokaryon incompatibility protein (HET)
LDALPQTLRDAIAVTKSISIPYLWVDMLCILQDSEDDKRHEMSMMECVYRDSLVTIVVASSENASQGFLHPRQKPKEAYMIPFRPSESQFGTMSLDELDAMEYDESLEPINKRAWTLQESMLAHRYLIYSSHTLQWRCKADVRNLGNSLHFVSHSEETIQSSHSLYLLNKPASDPESELKRWIRLVGIYSDRSASFPHDKLNAISAVAKGFSPMLGPLYHAGIWDSLMLWQLTWVTSNLHDPNVNSTRPDIYRAPSWSWASIDGGLFYPYRLLEPIPTVEYLYRCDFIYCETVPKSPEFPFGEVLAGYLKLKGVLRQAWLVPSAKKILWLAEDDESLAAAEALHPRASQSLNGGILLQES